MNHTHTRDTHIDSLRGTAVVLMIIAHGIFFFHTGSSIILNTIAHITNIITLSIFVFVSGLSASWTLKKQHSVTPKHFADITVTYISQIYLAYAVVQIFGILLDNFQNGLADLPGKIVSALTLKSPLHFTEYMALFVAFPVIIYFFRPYFILLKKHSGLLIVSAIISYSAGLLLYFKPDILPFENIREFLAGGENSLRFPLLYYLPIFLSGLWWNDHAEEIRAVMLSIIVLSLYLFTTLTGWNILNPDVRWPPSIGFIMLGITVSTILYFALNYLGEIKLGKRMLGHLSYAGRDSLDFWLTHLILLFTYAAFIGYKSGNPLTVTALIAALFFATSFISSAGLTGLRSYASSAESLSTHEHARRFRKRYIVILFISAALLVAAISTSGSNTVYGRILKEPVQNSNKQIRISISSIRLDSSRTWYSKRPGPYSEISVSITANGPDGYPTTIPAGMLHFYATNAQILPDSYTTTENTVFAKFSATRFPAGIHSIRAEIPTENSTVKSNNITIHISEPLLVSWTFDWEGWAPEDAAISQIEKLSSDYPGLVFSHFVNPRTFITQDIPDSVKNDIRTFLSDRKTKGDAVAMHLHMHTDLVEQSGIIPHTDTHWGLRSDEGYDTPITRYSADEFEAIARYAKSILEDNGFGDSIGFRAGGWYITGDQMNTLESLGFLYDSSGRTKPEAGAFRKILWSLPEGAQPYMIRRGNLNSMTGSFGITGIMELPNNGLTTYDSSIEELIGKWSGLYAGGELSYPVSLVYVSHPQFWQREYMKIGKVLDAISAASFASDSGPALFTTTDATYELWKSLLR